MSTRQAGLATLQEARLSLVLAAALAIGAVAFSWPLFLTPASGVSAATAPLVFALVLPLVLAVVLTELSAGRLDAKTLAMLGVLAAVGTVLRPLSAGTAGFELVFFLIILAGRAYGAAFGFALGAITLFTSALITSGVGPWLPYQMLAAGFVGLFAGLLPKASGRAELALLAGYGVVSAFVYGWLMDFSFWPFALGDGTQLSFDPAAGPLANLHRFVLFNLATSMGWNLGRALTNALLIALLGAPLLRLLRRSGRRAQLLAPAIAAPASPE
ncbi:ECF transporter S component [Propionicimonas sp.]|uniref:ECF transporter S component n=1 Tax=Propionicimonas sp. TaxID=1955623 RepID=UPI0017A3F5F6|nr:ECF transporter S component [Propionicimonas sp.]MBU3976944.1 ECF transporter S component [Actinomycetota bacterium]MBA3020515.1 ECF transporter S component [Propionicimonas sp.]MBU3986689.1 ECF transporter S component [Actinomycetota bacterium]MBU4007159.1 ECF transporter S component [Actinomycetota bacterium]MBU4064912.1 ECF transporter S component [Actinomycetota bacterium]